MVTLLVISIIIKCRDKIRCYKKWKFFKMKSLGAYDLAARVDDMSLQDVMVDNPMYKGLYSSASEFAFFNNLFFLSYSRHG